MSGFTVPQREELLWVERATELAWAAGFFDGEGSIFNNRQKSVGGTTGKVYTINSPCLSVSQVDPRPLERFVAALGFGRKIGGPYKPRHVNAKPYYRWDACGRPSVHRTLTALWPYLSEPKREQALGVWRHLAEVRTPKSPHLPPLPGQEAA